jgi:hypothetical protein
MSCDTSSGGYLVCENVSSLTDGYQQVLWIVPIAGNTTHRFRLWMYFRLTSSFNTWATWSEEIFSRADRSWILSRRGKEARISV